MQLFRLSPTAICWDVQSWGYAGGTQKPKALQGSLFWSCCDTKVSPLEGLGSHRSAHCPVFPLCCWGSSYLCSQHLAELHPALQATAAPRSCFSLSHG